MWWMERVDRLDRRWTVDDLGHHIQFGDLLAEISDEVAEERNLFSTETILEAVDSVAVAPNGNDRKDISVSRLRTALKTAGIE